MSDDVFHVDAVVWLDAWENQQHFNIQTAAWISDAPTSEHLHFIPSSFPVFSSGFQSFSASCSRLLVPSFSWYVCTSLWYVQISHWESHLLLTRVIMFGFLCTSIWVMSVRQIRWVGNINTHLRKMMKPSWVSVTGVSAPGLGMSGLVFYCYRWNVSVA